MNQIFPGTDLCVTYISRKSDADEEHVKVH